MNDTSIYKRSFLSQKNSTHLLYDWLYVYVKILGKTKILLIYWIILVYIIGPFSVQKFPLIYWIILVYIIGPFSVQKFPLIYWIILVYIIGPFSVKKFPLIYWIILLYIISPASVPKISLIFGMIIVDSSSLNMSNLLTVILFQVFLPYQ